MAEPFEVPDLKAQVGWRMNEQDMKDMRILMADRREKVIANILRALVHEEAETARRRWRAAASRIAAQGEASG